MGEQKIIISLKRKIARTVITLLCVAVACCVTYVMTKVYEPNLNAMGAFASVCLDIICIIIVMVLVMNFAFEKGSFTKTTKLFLGLMLGTLVVLFLDFMNWALDGSLAYGEISYVYTICSLCGGSLLAALFVLYLSSYMDEMYRLKKFVKVGMIFFWCNILDFVITVVLGVTHKAFVFVDGHYETGTMYDVITVIPVLSLVILTIYAFRYIKVIGLHDVMAVFGYIFIMIAGAIFESIAVVGTTYVAVTVADIFIFVLLQNNLIDRVREQRNVLSKAISSQYAILESMAGIYLYVNLIDLENKYVRKFEDDETGNEPFELDNSPHSRLNVRLYEGIEDDIKERFWAFTDLSTLAERMGNDKIISAEFFHKTEGWFRAIYIRIGESVDGPVSKVIYTIRNIDEEKKNVEKWIRKSNTDELTGFYNRHAYEEDIAALESSATKDNLVYVSIDVNSLKLANDTLGHDAGDELIVGASECMKQSFGAYGKLYRTGGDEFVALIFADNNQLEIIKKDIHEVTAKWHGKLNNQLTISCGYVAQKEAADMSLHQIAILADKRMYEDKKKYYQKKGIDRRGQQDAHVALCELYTKILKINVSDDTYQIVNMDSAEQTKEKGFADTISAWLHDFGESGQVHPDDLEGYFEKTSLEYIRDYFKEDATALYVFYRRKYGEDYRRVMMEMIPANDYTDENQTLFLYVKNIEK